MIAEFLIQKETITGKEFMKIFREAKGIPEPEEEKTETTAEEKAFYLMSLHCGKCAFAEIWGFRQNQRLSLESNCERRVPSGALFTSAEEG